jgi:putative RNA 2'-phosphotransferase
MAMTGSDLPHRTTNSGFRAAQGHSVTVQLGLAAQQPPHVLYHGTATRFVGSILAEGLKQQSRQQVHLSTDEVTAHRVTANRRS